MFVSRIEQISKTKFQVTTGDEDVFLLKEKDILLYHIKEGEEISQENLLLLVEGMRKECLRRSGMLLQSRDYSQVKLKEKLLTYGFPLSIVENTILKLKEANYVNDERLAQNYIRYHLYQAQDKSLRRIRMDLMGKGIGEEQISRAIVNVNEEESGDNTPKSAECKQICEILRKKRYDSNTASWEEKQKLMAFLYRKGYSQDAIRTAMEAECE